jgi:hypothetical protein
LYSGNILFVEQDQKDQIDDFMIGLNNGMEEKIDVGSNWVSQTFSCDHETSAKFVRKIND